jgi:glycerol-3-phosphate dehydrogenase subunit B
MPACFGLADDRLYQLAAAAPALPAAPAADAAAFGARDAPARPAAAAFYSSGGTWLAGDEVIVSAIATVASTRLDAQHGDIPLRPRFAVLASGSFFSNGLVADAARARADPRPRPAADLPRENWYQRDFFASQPWQRFGLKTDAMLRPLLDGQPLGNLFAIGSLLGGFDAIQLGCGGGVCAVTALHVARQIHDLAGGAR